MTERLRRVLPLLLGTGLFALSVWYLARSVAWAQVVASLRSIDVATFVLGAGASILTYFLLRTLRWWLMVRPLHPEIRIGDLYPVVAVSLGLALVTPGQLGEVLKVEIVRRRGLLKGLPGMGSFVVERAIDAAVLATLFAVSLAMGSGLGGRWPVLRWAAAALFSASLITLVVLRFFNPGGRWGSWMTQLRAAGGTRRSFPALALLSLASWLVVAAGWHASLISAGVRIHYLDTLSLMCVIAVAQVASFVPGAIGVAEALTIELLMALGFGHQAGVASATVLRLYGLLTIFVGAMHFVLLVYPQRAKKSAPTQQIC